jgi:hypothetical protein
VKRQSFLGLEQGHSRLFRHLEIGHQQGHTDLALVEAVTAQRFDPDARRGLIGEPVRAGTATSGRGVPRVWSGTPGVGDTALSGRTRGLLWQRLVNLVLFMDR